MNKLLRLLIPALSLTALALIASQCSLNKQSAGVSEVGKLDGFALIPAGSFKMGNAMVADTERLC